MQEGRSPVLSTAGSLLPPAAATAGMPPHRTWRQMTFFRPKLSRPTFLPFLIPGNLGRKKEQEGCWLRPRILRSYGDIDTPPLLTGNYAPAGTKNTPRRRGVEARCPPLMEFLPPVEHEEKNAAAEAIARRRRLTHLLTFLPPPPPPPPLVPLFSVGLRPLKAHGGGRALLSLSLSLPLRSKLISSPALLSWQAYYYSS